MSVDANISAITDLSGKTVGDLQRNVSISDAGAVTGSLLHVTGYTGYSEDTSLQTGNYLALHAETPEVEGSTLTATFAGGEYEFDSNGNVVIRVTGNTSQTLTVVASKNGYRANAKEFNLSGLVLYDS